jgi:DNA (cytosine-5)-methyltransferase 1
MVFLENVDRLLKSPASQRGRDFAIMLASLSDAGYFVEWRVVNAAEYGFPQRRKRVFIVAKNNKYFTPPVEGDLSFLTKDGVMARALPVRDILTDNVQPVTLVGGLDELTQTFGVGDKSSKFLTAGYMVGRSVTTSKVEAFPEKHLGKRKFQRWHLEHVLQEDVDNEFQIPRSDWGKWQGAKNGGNSGRTHSSGFKYTYSEGRMSFPDEINRPARTILTAEGGSSPSRFKHAVDDLVGVRRRLTPIELELLNDFPVDWTKEGLDCQMTNVRRAFFMGNALIVGVVERIGLVLAADWGKVSPEA